MLKGNFLENPEIREKPLRNVYFIKLKKKIEFEQKFTIVNREK